MTRVALFIDDGNISAGITNISTPTLKRRVNWRALMSLASLFGDVQIARMYDAISPEFSGGDKHLAFIDIIEAFGLNYIELPFAEYLNGATRTVKADADTYVVTDMLTTLDSYDVAILATGDADYLPVVRELRNRGKRVIGTAFTNIATALRREVDYWLSAWLIPGIFDGDAMSGALVNVRGLCHYVSARDNSAYVRYLKPDFSGSLWETDTRSPKSAWTNAQFTASGSMLRVLPSKEAVLEFQLLKGGIASNVSIVHG